MEASLVEVSEDAAADASATEKRRKLFSILLLLFACALLLPSRGAMVPTAVNKVERQRHDSCAPVCHRPESHDSVRDDLPSRRRRGGGGPAEEVPSVLAPHIQLESNTTAGRHAPTDDRLRWGRRHDLRDVRHRPESHDSVRDNLHSRRRRGGGGPMEEVSSVLAPQMQSESNTSEIPRRPLSIRASLDHPNPFDEQPR